MKKITFRFYPEINEQFFYKGQKNNFSFIVQQNHRLKWYANVTHKKQDIRYNSLWDKITFESKEEAFEWCDSFDHTNYACRTSPF
jgi:uncharacterized protein YxeA